MQGVTERVFRLKRVHRECGCSQHRPVALVARRTQLVGASRPGKASCPSPVWLRGKCQHILRPRPSPVVSSLWTASRPEMRS